MIGPGLIGLVSSPISAILLFSLGAFAHQMLSSLLYALVTDCSRSRMSRPRPGSAAWPATSAARLFSLMLGQLASTVGYEPLFVCLSVFDIVALIVVWVVIGERRRGVPAGAAATRA